MGFYSDKSGSIAIYTAIILIPLLVVVGLAVEFRQAADTKAEIQKALDSSLIAAVLSDESDPLQVGQNTFQANVLGLSALNISAELTLIDANTVEGTARANHPPILSQLIGRDGFLINVNAAATRSGDPAPPCIILTGENVPNALTVNGGARIETMDCGIHGHSTASPAANFSAGAQVNVESVCLSGTNIINNGGSINNLELGCTPEPDALAGTIPEPTDTACDNSLPRNINGGSFTLSPGVYCGGLNFNGTVDATFAPGLYIIRNGNWNVNGGDWEGQGVTFYFDDTSIIQFNSGVRADLTPPTSGDYEGVLFFERQGLPPSPFILNDTRGFDFSGLIQLPSRNVTVNGNGDVRQRDALLVFRSLIFNNSRWELENTELSGNVSTAPPVATLIR